MSGQLGRHTDGGTTGAALWLRRNVPDGDMRLHDGGMPEPPPRIAALGRPATLGIHLEADGLRRGGKWGTASTGVMTQWVPRAVVPAYEGTRKLWLSKARLTPEDRAEFEKFGVIVPFGVPHGSTIHLNSNGLVTDKGGVHLIWNLASHMRTPTMNKSVLPTPDVKNLPNVLLNAMSTVFFGLAEATTTAGTPKDRIDELLYSAVAVTNLIRNLGRLCEPFKKTLVMFTEMSAKTENMGMYLPAQLLFRPEPDKPRVAQAIATVLQRAVKHNRGHAVSLLVFDKGFVTTVLVPATVRAVLSREIRTFDAMREHYQDLCVDLLSAMHAETTRVIAAQADLARAHQGEPPADEMKALATECNFSILKRIVASCGLGLSDDVVRTITAFTEDPGNKNKLIKVHDLGLGAELPFDVGTDVFTPSGRNGVLLDATTDGAGIAVRSEDAADQWFGFILNSGTWKVRVYKFPEKAWPSRTFGARDCPNFRISGGAAMASRGQRPPANRVVDGVGPVGGKLAPGWSDYPRMPRCTTEEDPNLGYEFTVSVPPSGSTGKTVVRCDSAAEPYFKARFPEVTSIAGRNIERFEVRPVAARVCADAPAWSGADGGAAGGAGGESDGGESAGGSDAEGGGESKADTMDMGEMFASLREMGATLDAMKKASTSKSKK